jgi:putative inorganic carbon (HCO3(-)) transporter
MAFFALLAYIFFVFIRPQEFFVPFMDMPLVKVSLIVATIFMFTQKERRFDAPQNMLLMFLIPIILMSGIMNGWFMGGVNSVQTYLTAIFLPFLVIQNIINTPTKQRMLMLMLIACTMVMLNDGIAQKASGTGVGWSGAALSEKTRITYLGIFNDPNDLAMFFVMTLPFTFYFFYHIKSVLRFVFLILSGFLLQGIYLTNSRGALLGTMSQLALWFYLKYGLKKSILLGGLAGPVALIIMSKFRAIDSEEASAEGRLESWYEGFQLLFWKPVLGVGMGQFTEHHYLTAHNSFVLIFTELGLSGYFLWMGFLTMCGVMLLALWQKNFKGSLVGYCSAEDTAIARTLTYSMVGYLVTCFFLSRAYTPLLYIFCAMLVATYYRATPEKSMKPERLILFKNYSGMVFWVFGGSLVTIYVVVRLLL